MAKKRSTYVKNNNKYYIFYTNASERNKLLFLAIRLFILFFLGIILYVTKSIFVKRTLFIEAGQTELGGEVIEWVNQQMRIHRFDIGTWGIILVISILLFVITYFTLFVPSYKMYKYNCWLIIPLISIVIFMIIILRWFSVNNKWVYLVTFIIEIAPILSIFNLLLPHDLRETYVSLIDFVTKLGNIIIKRL